MFDYSDLIAISRFAGERFDLVQAGGGNSSVKLSDGRLYVKASGIALGDAKGEEGFCCLEWPILLDFINSVPSDLNAMTLEEKAKALVARATRSTSIKPSIETLLHCILGPFTLHTHPITVNILACRQNWKRVLGELFPGQLLIDYATPGAPLARSLASAIRQHEWRYGESVIVFLQNHGLIVTGASADEVIELTEHVVETIGREISVDFSHYRLTNFVSKLVAEATGEHFVAFLCEDALLSEELKKNATPFFAPPSVPDQLVYCGATCIEVEADSGGAARAKIADFLKNYGAPPSLIIVHYKKARYLIIVGQTIRKCREIEEVLKSHILILNASQSSPVQFLTESEISYLSNWDAEKYRQKI